jgi:PhnB protein
MKRVNPYLNFPGNTEEAFNFYRSVFGGELAITRFRDLEGNPMAVPDHELDRIANVELQIGAGSALMGTDVLESWSPVTFGNNSFILLETDSRDEAERLFGSLSDGGKLDMELQPTPWAELYGIASDRFGVQWMVMYTGSVEMAATPASR